jgi:hypothetical protein
VDAAMETERWYLTETLFQAALDCPEVDRTRFVGEACRDDPELGREVAALVASASKTRARGSSMRCADPGS